MSQHGLQAVLNPSEIYLSEEHSDSEFLVGLAVAVVMDGSRAFLIEIQVLLYRVNLDAPFCHVSALLSFLGLNNKLWN